LPGSITLKDLPYTSESLARNSSYATSRIIRADRQVVDSILTDVNAGGDINYELLYRGLVSPATVALDDFIEAAMMSAGWSTPSSDTTAVVISGGNTLTAGGIGAKFNAGDVCRVNSASNINSYQIVTVSAAGALTVVPGGLVNESSATVEDGAFVSNGITFRSFTIEKGFTDLTNILAKFSGMVIDGWSLDIGIGGPIGGAFRMIGKSEVDTTSTIHNAGTEQTPAVNRVFSSVSHMKQILVGSGLTNLQIQEFGFDLRNNDRARTAVGVLGAISIGTGSVDITGRLIKYFDSTAAFSDFLTDTESQIFLVLHDALGNGYTVQIPGIVFTGGRRVGGGINTDIRAELTWQARASTRYAAVAETIRVTRFDA
jgi:hypothetical protein